MKMVLYPGVDNARLDKLAAAAGAMRLVNAADEAEAEREIVDADAFFGKLTPTMLAAAGRLRWVQCPTASLEHYVFPELIAHPCELTNMRGLYSDVIAEHVFGFMLCFARRLHVYIRQQTQGHWEAVGGETERTTFRAGPGVTSEIDRAHGQLGGTTLGVVGLGHIGRAIAQRGKAFGMRVVAVDPQPQEPPAAVDALWPTEQLDRLLEESDWVVIAAPHTPQTERLFNRARLRRMKRSAYLVNIGRGAIVVLDDLVAALEAGELAGAALDVFEVEPLPADHPLWGMENVILTPHIAGCAPPIAARHLEVLCENVARFARGEELINVASKAAWF